MPDAKTTSKIRLVIGLGNPGPDYKNTYHNAGFLFIDCLTNNRQIFNFQFSIFKSNDHMNESGKFVKKALKKYGVRPEELLIAHDDSDIELGKYKLSFDRGAAGHHGIESIIQSLGTKKFWRLRLGIRPIGSKNKAGEFVLRKIGKNDAAKLNAAFEKIAELLAQ